MMDLAYKKPREKCGSYTLPSFSDRLPHTDMNIAIALSCMMAVMWLLGEKCDAAPELVGNVHRRFRNRPFLRRYAIEDLVGEDDEIDLNKRQHFDDYGHMRFGKREQFDDYGHMRFGRNHE